LNVRCFDSDPSNGEEIINILKPTLTGVGVLTVEESHVTIRRRDQYGPIIDRVTIDMDDLNSGYDSSDE